MPLNWTDLRNIEARKSFGVFLMKNVFRKDNLRSCNEQVQTQYHAIAVPAGAGFSGPV